MLKFLSVLEAIDGIIAKLQKVLLVIGVVAMVAINGAQVFCRFVIHSSIPWSEQVSLVLFLILIMVGGNLAIRTDTETRIDALKFKSARVNDVIRLISDIVCLVVLVIFLVASKTLVQQTAKFPQYLSSLMLSYVYIYIWLVIGFILMIYAKFINVIKGICRICGLKEGEKA